MVPLKVKREIVENCCVGPAVMHGSGCWRDGLKDGSNGKMDVWGRLNWVELGRDV